MNKNFKRKYSEGSFLFATFCEFVKCWGSGAKSRLFIESVKGNAFVNFSAFLGHPRNAHFVPKRKEEVETRAREGNPDGQHKLKPRKKSERKTERDNLRAAKFQEKKLRESQAAAAATATSSPAAAAPSTSPPEFSFSLLMTPLAA